MIATTIEQSKHLIELGVDINTADMHYYKNSFGDYIEGLYNSSDLKEGCELKGIEYIPAWSLSALLKMFPNGLWYNNDYAVPILLPQIKNKWICRLYNPEKDIDIFYIKDNPFDAVFEMICWLKEKYK